jgi:O-antigen/teichoic acid export membrane protein
VTKNSLSRNMSWNVLGGAGAKLLTPLFQIAIARILSPADYGSFAVAMAVVYLHDVFKDLGLNDAIIATYQSEQEISTLFTIQLITGVLSYLGVVLICVFIPELMGFGSETVGLLLVTTLVFLINPFIDPILTYFRIKHNYRFIAIRQFILALTSGIVGLVLAYLGFGGYSLAIGFVLGSMLSALYLFNMGGGPKIQLKIESLARLMATGKHLLAQRASGYLVSSGDTFLINAYLGAQSLGLYRMGHQIINLIPNSTFFLANQVLFSEFSSRAKLGEFDYIKKVYRRYAVLSGILLLLFSISVLLFGESIVSLFLGSKWLGIVDVLILLSAGLSTGFMSLPNIDLAKVFGFSHVYTIYGIVRGASTFLAVFVFARFGIEVAVIAWVSVNILSNLVNELIFFAYQRNISCFPIKLLLYLLNITWFIILSTHILPKNGYI